MKNCLSSHSCHFVKKNFNQTPSCIRSICLHCSSKVSNCSIKSCGRSWSTHKATIHAYTKAANRVAQSVKCLATDACLTTDQGVASSIPVRSHTFVEIDHKMISMVILLLLLIHSRRVVVSYKWKYVHQLLVNRLFEPAQEKSVIRWTDRPAMTIAVDLGRKATKQTKTNNIQKPY